MASRRGKKDMTPEQERKFLRLVAEGHTLAAAAKAIGFGKAAISMRRERNKGFAAKLEEAEEQLESTLSGEVIKAAPKDWRAAMAYLERRWPQRWARAEIRNEITNVNVAATDIAAAVHAGLAALAKRHAPPDEPDVDATEPAKPMAPTPEDRASGVARS